MTTEELKKTGAWRQWIIDQARTWKGTPYQHKARIKGVGVDCGALLYEVYNPIFGPFKPFPKDYPQDWALHRKNEIYLGFLEGMVKPVEKAMPAGIAVFQVGRNFAHGAICTEKNTFIHAWGRNQSGCVVESGLNFFRMGNGGKPREVRYFDVVDSWLSS